MHKQDTGRRNEGAAGADRRNSRMNSFAHLISRTAAGALMISIVCGGALTAAGQLRSTDPSLSVSDAWTSYAMPFCKSDRCTGPALRTRRICRVKRWCK